MTFCPRCGAVVEAGADCPACGPRPDARWRWAAALAYFWLPALAFLFLNPFRRNAFVRFHSLQALMFGVAVALLNTALGMVAGMFAEPGAGPLVYGILWGLVRLALFLLWVLGFLKAFLGEEYKLPWVGAAAGKLATR